ncbi:hypothetical protein ABZ470_39885 [Streptosporangium sp. NPDC020072]|uniref:hypothetical protein n=1 Tax=Streptosporangium sp. NPDC020072 TaxID=3154788 RepID=UPI003412AE83
MCFAGTACDLTGGQWLVQITSQGPTVAGQLVDPNTIDLDGDDLEYLLAEPDDPEDHLRTAHGHQVISVEARAARLLDLGPDAGRVFYAMQDLETLRRTGENIYGPRTS